MIRIGYFCTAGHTEAGGIQRFLTRIDASVQWERCFPAIQKPGPKLGRPAPKHKEGLTGDGLVGEMMDRLARFHRAGTTGALDIVVLIDDADCRFDGDASRLDAWVNQRTTEIGTATGAPPPAFVVLFASPEIEAWFLADWEEGFGKEYAKLPAGEDNKHFRTLVDELLDGSEIERYGGGLVNVACANKLSEKLQDLVTRLGGAYSKRNQGQDMLLRIRPDKVADRCAVYFRPALQHLRRTVTVTGVMES